MKERYKRNQPALKEEECQLLHQKHVLVVGAGGLGGYLIELLARLGVGHIRLCDGDVFEESNLNRQLLCTHESLGHAKARTAQERVAQINKDVHCEAIEDFFSAQNAAALLDGIDLVLDGLDNPQSRRDLANACKEANIPYVYGAISGWVAQAAVILPGEPLIDMLYPPNAKLSDKSSLAFTPSLCASLEVSLATKLLVGRPVQSGTLYYIDLFTPEFETIPLV